MRVRFAGVVAILFGFAGLAPPAGAQFYLTGTVVDSAFRAPIAGAVVLLLDASGGTIGRRLANERGEYRVALTEDARTARFVHIGFAPREFPVPHRDAARVRLDVSMPRLSNIIQAVHVLGNARCRARKDRLDALGLWDQARAGLLATVVSREENAAKIVRLGFDRVMDGNSERIDVMRVRADSSDATASSFVAVHSAKDFVRDGFSSEGAARGTYFAPDADVLLNDAFAAGYCFEIADRDRARPNEIGLRFNPADHQNGRVDIDGTLWIDTVARELREVRYDYVNIEAGAKRFHPGGYVSFRSMKNGAVLIDRWSIRVVSAAQDTVMAATGSDLAVHDWLFAEEQGGELARAEWNDGLAWNAALGTARIHAVTRDSKPAAGAVIALAGTPYFGAADANGRIEIKDLLPGPYTVRIVDPLIAALGIGLPTAVKFSVGRDTTSVSRLVVPTAKEFALDRCKAAGVKLGYSTTAGRTFAVLGRVVDSNGKSVKDATVSVASIMLVAQPDGSHYLWLKDHWTTGSDGLFQACHNWDEMNEILIRVHRFESPDVDVRAQFTSDLLVIKIPVP